MIAQIQIEYVIRRCFQCGTNWAIERFRNDEASGLCPICLARDRDKAWKSVEKLNRANAALRGIINRRVK